MPVVAIKSSSRIANLLSFLLKNIYCVSVQCSMCVVLFTLIYSPIKSGKLEKLSYDEFVILICYLNSLVIAITFFIISYKLPSLYNEWKDFDYYVKHISDDSEKNETFYSRFILVMCMIMALIEEFLSKVTDYEYASRCFYLYESSFEGFTREIIPSFFKVYSYSHYWGVFIVGVSVYRSIIWSFSDVFFIIIFNSIYVKLKNFNRGVDMVKLLVSIFGRAP